MSDDKSRRRLINLGELIALAALAVSAAGVWIAWKNSNQDRPTRLLEQHPAVPLALRGNAERDGRTLDIMPADPTHALESLTLKVRGSPLINVGSDGRLSASDVESVLKGKDKETKDVAYSIPVRIEAHYVEAGTDRRSDGNYVLRYKWEGGGLFGNRSIRLMTLIKA